MKPTALAIAAATMLAGGPCFAQGSQGSASAAAGDTNQAVATTSANAPEPAHGHNSFTAGQAKTRIENNGYSNVTDLQEDNNGVWHGKAEKNGAQTMVWLDYKGNVGQAQ